MTMRMRKERDSSISTPIAKPVVLVFMGVSGCGKTTVAAILAGRLGWPFEEGDAMHPQSNIEKMAAGHPLTNEDRAPWMSEEELDAVPSSFGSKRMTLRRKLTGPSTVPAAAKISRSGLPSRL
jgi:ABC-type taurine transport system ATPase subunit